MRLAYSLIFVLAAVILNCQTTSGQLPPRLAIPGAVLLPQQKPLRRLPNEQVPQGVPQRLRRPIPNAVPLPIRPVVEENDEPPRPTSQFDDEVNKLGLSVLQSAVRQAEEDEEELNSRPSPLPFRPERPVPVLRQDIRETLAQPVLPAPRPVQRPVQRQQQQQFQEEVQLPHVRQQQPVRQPVRQQILQQPQVVRQQAAARVTPRPHYNADEEEERGGRTRKPTVQILRKYRTDNADGSITWGYENDDGSFKEETLGVDCVTRGKYGYVDPDGVRRDYSYETGNKCDEPEEEEELALPARPQQHQPQNIPPRKPQYRPLPAQ